MKKIKVSDKYFTTYIPESEVQKAVRAVAEKLNRRFAAAGDGPVFVSILNGSFVFTADLLRYYDGPCAVSFVKMSSYAGTASTGKVEEMIGLGIDLCDKDVVIVEDMIETGTTIQRVYEIIKAQKPRSVCVAALMVKKNRYKGGVPVEYPAIELDKNDFVVGYGLDYNDQGRNLQDIYILSNE